MAFLSYRKLRKLASAVEPNERMTYGYGGSFLRALPTFLFYRKLP